tara:strand:- start:237 stop:1118 length:882 start_codon:yes stop_codon:yes gene_type:complete
MSSEKNFKIGRLVFFVILTMSAFAANSLLARVAIANQEIGPSYFSLIRLISGSIILIILVFFRFGLYPVINIKPNLQGVIGLSLYMVGFHYAYIFLEAGIGSIILFGGVQVVMFTSSILTKQRPTLFNWIGMIAAMIGIILLFFPFHLNSSQPMNGIILMLMAALGWGIYSVSGTKSKNPLTTTMSNFIFTIPIVMISFVIYPENINLTYFGIFLAICSGAVMSGLGYSLWYTILPYLEKTIAALVQLLVPVIALALSISFLDEKLTYLSFLSSILVIFGVFVGIYADKYKKN